METEKSIDITEFQRLVDNYFAACEEGGELFGEAGLALALDVPLETLRTWYDGSDDDPVCRAVHRAYLRIMRQIECGQGYQGMSTLGAMKLKQRRLGGYLERPERERDVTVRVTFGPHTDETDFD